MVRVGSSDTCELIIRFKEKSEISSLNGPASTLPPLVSPKEKKSEFVDKLHKQRVASIHCLLFAPMIPSSLQRELFNKIKSKPDEAYPDDTKDVRDDCSRDFPSVVDNHSKWGTYVVSQKGCNRVSTKLHKATCLTPGDLVCIRYK